VDDNKLSRTTFSTSRAAEFLEERALQAQTGQSRANFGDVVLKELVDNALDECETAGVTPEVEIEQDGYGLRISDNGRGLTTEIVERVLDFNTLTSDKAAYRSPTRGLQGNALKTVLGIARVRSGRPVLVDSLGVQHRITVSINPAGGIAIDHTRAPSERTDGTRISVPVKPESAWSRRFAVFNPHLNLSDQGQTADDEWAEFYKRTVGDDWRKPLPTDKTSPHWYDEAALQKLVFSHIEASHNGHRDLPLGEFVRQFDGLSSTVKAKKVITAIPDIRRLSDFEAEPGWIPGLLRAMQDEARIPQPKVLGRIPEQHYRACLERWYGIDTDGWWFRHKALMVDGIPWVIEFALAATEGEGDCFFGVNYSPTYSDPLAGQWLEGHGDSFSGVESVLSEADALPALENDYQRACALHIISPALEFTDKGKTHLNPPEPVVEAIEAMLRSTKDLFKAHKRTERAVAAELRRSWQPVKDQEALLPIVAEVMDEAVAAASDNGKLPYSARTLYYQVRPRIQRYTDKPLTMGYFSQTLLVQYQREHDKLPGLYREPRGHLIEPHTAIEIPLGTLELAKYTPTPWTYNKIFFVEKAGLWPVLQAALIGERYDMAVIRGAGEPVEAIRAWLENQKPGDYEIFSLTDADRHGYGIRHTLTDETWRMPGYSIKVTHLGLTAAQALDAGLATEKVVYQSACPERVLSRLDEVEREWFEGVATTVRHTGRNRVNYDCLRAELNAFAGADLIAFVERRLQEEDASPKVVPPVEVIDKRIVTYHRERAGIALRLLIDELLGTGDLVDELVKPTNGLKVPREDIVKALSGHPPELWSTTVERRIDGLLRDRLAKEAKAIIKRVARKIGE